MNPLLRLPCIAACIVACAVAGSRAGAETVFSSLSGTYASNVPVGLTGVDWTYAAQQFNTGTNTRVTDVTLNLSSIGGNNGSFNVEIWTSSSNAPGSLVGAIATGQSQGSVTGIQQTYTYSGSVPVSAGTDYWVVMNATNMNGQVLWSYTDDAPAQNPGFIGVVGTELLKTTDTLPTWSTPGGVTSGRMMMSVVAVPEPSTWALALAGLGLCGWRLGRRRRASARPAGRGG